MSGYYYGFEETATVYKLTNKTLQLYKIKVQIMYTAHD